MNHETTGRRDRRNYYLNILEGGAYTAGTSLISAQTVLPVLVTRFGGGNLAVGTLGVLTWAGTLLPQIFAARYGQSLRWKKPWAVRLGALQRLMVLFIAGILLLPERPDSSLRLVLFLLFFGCNQIIVGVSSPIWYDFFAKLIPAKRRGRSVGFRSALGGIFSIVGTFYLTIILTNYTFPVNFFIIFITAFLFESCSLLLQLNMVEDRPSQSPELGSVRTYYRQLRGILALDKNLRHFLAAASFLILATIPVAFFSLYGLSHFHLDEWIIGEFTFMMVCGQIFGAVAMGYIADHLSNKIALVATAGSLLAATFLALFSPSLAWYRLVFYFLGLNLGSEVMIRYNFIAEYCQAEFRSVYIGLTNTLLAPWYLVALLGGVIINILGYTALFIIGATCSAVGIIYLWYIVQEPIVRQFAPASSVKVEEVTL